jgi:hypothetical protein
MRVQQSDEVVPTVANGTEERGITNDGRHQVDVSTIGNEALTDVDAAELRNDVEGGVASERTIHNADAAACIDVQRGSRMHSSKHADEITALQI